MATGYEDIEKLSQEQNKLIETQKNQQNEVINKQTQMEIDALNRDKAKMAQEAQKTASGLYTDYQKNLNQYGVGTEKLVEQGLGNSGYAETSRTSLYNTYQKGVTDTLNKSNELKADYDFKIDQARQTGNVRQAQSALDLYAQKLQMLTQNFQLRQDREHYLYQKDRDKIQDKRWQDQFNYQKGRDTLEDQRWQKQFDYQSNRDSIADRRWQQQQDYQKGRDTIADNRWQQQQDYQKNRDNIADRRWQDQYNYQKNRDNISDQRWREQFNHQKSREAQQDRQWQLQYDLSKKKSASSGRSGRSGGTHYSVGSSKRGGNGISDYAINLTNNLNKLKGKDDIVSRLGRNKIYADTRTNIANMVNQGTLSRADADYIFRNVGL